MTEPNASGGCGCPGDRRDRLRYLWARLHGCTGAFIPGVGVQHDGDTCPVHERG